MTAKSPPGLWQKVLLMIGGVGFALLLATVLLSAFPNLIGGNRPLARTQANTEIHVQFHHSNGDLFTSLPGRIRPPPDDALLADFTLAFDADSFRIPALQAEHYPIAAFGDSFTEAPNAAAPWPDGVAARLGVPVRNYGFRSYGPLEVQNTVREFANRETRTWLLYAFFAGNDLGDANRSAALAERSPLYLLPQLAEQAAREMSTQVAGSSSEHYDFPMPVIIGGNYYEMAFLTYYLFRQLAPPEGFAASRTFEIFAEAVDDITANTPGMCHALIFIPTKEQLYYPYIHPALRQYLRDNAFRAVLDGSRMLQLEAAPLAEADESAFISGLTAMRDAVRDFMATRADWLFIDLLPMFQQHVDAGELLYYPYDSHWNQAGHDLTAQVIADALRDVPGCPVT